ncbi:hypothetical protein Tco_1082794 [Tanacetum coccineum]|uniref:MAK10-like protein n=1 Tax=Tanacetum coccineum TaxID=301880 RepID=A0ABQ5I2B7_9ASTR
MGDENPIRTLGDYSKPSYEDFRNTIELPEGNNVDLLQKFPHHVIDLWLQVQIFHDHVNPATRRTIDQSAGGKLRDKNNKESWALLEDLALYDNESWNDPRDFTKPVKAISLPQDVPSTSDRHLIELENQFQRLMEAYLATKKHVQVNKISSSCEICNGPYDTQYCMENPEQAFVEYASSHTDEARGKWYTFKTKQNNLGDTYNPSWKSHPNLRLSKFEADFKQQQSEMTNKIDTVLKAITNRINSALPSDTKTLNAQTKFTVRSTLSQNIPSGRPSSKTTSQHEEKDNPENINTNPSSPPDPSVSFITEKVCKLNSFFESLGLVPQSSNTEFVCKKEDDGDVMFIEIVKKNDDSRKEEPEVGENAEA